MKNANGVLKQAEATARPRISSTSARVIPTRTRSIVARFSQGF